MDDSGTESQADGKQPAEPIRVCFVVLNAFPAINPEVPGAIGGIETRAWMLARTLARRPDIDVQFVVRHTERIRQLEFDGVRLVPIHDRLYRLREAVSTMLERQQRFPWLRFHGFSPALLWQLPILAVWWPWRRLRQRAPDPLRPCPPYTTVEADLLACFGVNVTTATVIASAHATNRPAILFLGSDADLDERYTATSTFVTPYGDPGPICRWAIDHADRIVVQTPSQQQVLRERFGREGTLIGNPIDLEEWDSRLETALPPEGIAGLDRYVLWVGRAEGTHKRPQLLVELARKCPELPFVMILNPRDTLLEQQIRRTAPSNVRILDWVPFPQMPAVFRRAAVLVNTSSLEGFSNAFLQAAASGVPIAALEVARDFLEESGAGAEAEGSMERLAEIVRRQWNEPDAAQLRKARAYVEQHHALPAQAEQVAAVIPGILSGRQRR
ncbi:Glycosyl transferases group 1 [Maioricimonas rarisocia]|uniref:Glycosyl transferases group 1 n=1 Tax=Maioricimonas rarisocia TaxID=2528026 RepID=A0A517Z8C5_9PLAN|nr:glycosyltransferase family 4 protein [Maioricimonas rarisocia]QDU38728.1 Glycosyl transferases group 1 [Maioricimonas rarisocia]